MFGVPIDPKDNPAKLAEYESRYRPTYRLLADLSIDDQEHIQQVLQATQTDALSSTIVTDMDGRILEAFLSVPTVSAIAKLLLQQQCHR